MKKVQEFVDVEDIKMKLLEMSQKEAERCGVGRSTFHGIKKRIRDNEDLNLNTPAVRRLIEKLKQ
ncbi:hypothetical protein [Methanococcoides burtonii]|uniref:hypothetical protein n=1 Tax=Methanococcoides burtonii TaxID=29291 RepID=UPI0000398E6B|nr:hypothetical protein [Methanococcoides burtonii]